MIRRLPVDAPVRKPDSDDELLRIVASAANEAVDALELPAAKVAAALNESSSRYARTLRLTTPILDDALRGRADGAAQRRRRRRRAGGADDGDAEGEAGAQARQPPACGAGETP